jgi:hypothetical protein
MPKTKGRGKVVKYRTKQIPGDKEHYLLCEIMEKKGPKGGKTVCHKKKKKSK